MQLLKTSYGSLQANGNEILSRFRLHFIEEKGNKKKYRFMFAWIMEILQIFFLFQTKFKVHILTKNFIMNAFTTV